METDIVTVFHRRENRLLAQRLEQDLAKYESGYNFIAVDNTKINRGFAKGCNLGAREGTAPIIGFLNPDVKVRGSFLRLVHRELAKPDVVITGRRYNKPQHELKAWGITNFVCGACFFVRRDWFEERGGFDQHFVMYFEETDLIRQAETEGKRVTDILLPIEHQSPTDDPPEDQAFKAKHFTRSARVYEQKWKLRRGQA